MVWLIIIMGILLLGGLGFGTLQGVQRIYGDTSPLLSDETLQDILNGYIYLWCFSIFIKSMKPPMSSVECVIVGIVTAFVYCSIIRKIRTQQSALAAGTGQWADYIMKWGMTGAVSVGLLGWGLSAMMIRPHFMPARELYALDYVFGVTLLSFGIGGLSGILLSRSLWFVIIEQQKTRFYQFFYVSLIGFLAGGWINIIDHPYAPLSEVYMAGGAIGGVISGLLSCGRMISSRYFKAVITGIAKGFAEVIVLILSGVRFSTIICGHCYRYIEPVQSQYEKGKRYCKQCQSELPFTDDPGKVIVTFGNVPRPAGQRLFILENPDFEHIDHRTDVSEVHFDPASVDSILLERFITYILNSPPKYGLQSVQIFYQGELDNLGKHLKNALQNNFECVERITV